jgi:hypothetical protein
MVSYYHTMSSFETSSIAPEDHRFLVREEPVSGEEECYV